MAALHDTASDLPLALATKIAGAERITALDRLAEQASLHTGMTVAEARAMCPALRIVPHDASADDTLLEHIADWADRYTPMVGRDPPHGLLLDITGAAHLAGGEIALARDLIARLARQGITAAVGIGPTAGSAWALVRARGRGHIPDTAPPSALDAALTPLPVASLRLPPETIAALRRLGLKTLCDLITRPREPVTARFGPTVLMRLDQARGLIDEPITPRQPIPPAVISETLAEPILTTAAVDSVTRLLAPRLAHMLEDRGQGATAIELAVFRVDGRVQRIAIRLAEPTRDPNIISDLLALRLDHLDDPLDPGFGYDAVRLAATAVAKKVETAVPLAALSGPADHEAGLLRARLIDRLNARFGAAKILEITTAGTHIPERADRLAVLSRAHPSTPKSQNPSVLSHTPRPLRLLEQPEPIDVMAEVPDGPPLNIRWRRRPLRIVSADGPERIAPEWWRQWHHIAPTSDLTTITRDYWKIEDHLGRRLWIFRLGFYGNAEAPPRWFVHGLFA